MLYLLSMGNVCPRECETCCVSAAGTRNVRLPMLAIQVLRA